MFDMLEQKGEETYELIHTIRGSGNHWRQQRDILMYLNGFRPGPFVAPIPIPANNQIVVGVCLIWCGRLNVQGYPSPPTQDHRESFRRSRGRDPIGQVLHLCHRRACVQPAHLYDGTPSDNAEDRHQRISFDDFRKAWNENLQREPKVDNSERDLLRRLQASMPSLDWTRTNKEWALATEAGKYEIIPEGTPMALEAAGRRPLFLQHDCKPEVPAGDAFLCRVCGMTPVMVGGIPTMENILKWESYYPQAIRRTMDYDTARKHRVTLFPFLHSTQN